MEGAGMNASSKGFVGQEPNYTLSTPCAVLSKVGSSGQPLERQSAIQAGWLHVAGMPRGHAEWLSSELDIMHNLYNTI